MTTILPQIIPTIEEFVINNCKTIVELMGTALEDSRTGTQQAMLNIQTTIEMTLEGVMTSLKEVGGSQMIEMISIRKAVLNIMELQERTMEVVEKVAEMLESGPRTDHHEEPTRERTLADELSSTDMGTCQPIKYHDGGEPAVSSSSSSRDIKCRICNEAMSSNNARFPATERSCRDIGCGTSDEAMSPNDSGSPANMMRLYQDVGYRAVDEETPPNNARLARRLNDKAVLPPRRNLTGDVQHFNRSVFMKDGQIS